jgi:hypothetical protein
VTFLTGVGLVGVTTNPNLAFTTASAASGPALQPHTTQRSGRSLGAATRRSAFSEAAHLADIGPRARRLSLTSRRSTPVIGTCRE